MKLDWFNQSSLERDLMKSRDRVLNVLFPAARAEILQALFMTPAKPRYVRELMRMSGLALRTIQEELSKLTRAGLIINWSNGYHRFYQPNGSHPICPHLRRIMEEGTRGLASSELPAKRTQRSRAGNKRRNRKAASF